MDVIRREDVLSQSHWNVFPLTRGTALECEYRLAPAGEPRDFFPRAVGPPVP